MELEVVGDEDRVARKRVMPVAKFLGQNCLFYCDSLIKQVELVTFYILGLPQMGY